jgi:hypothetical protein
MSRVCFLLAGRVGKCCERVPFFRSARYKGDLRGILAVRAKLHGILGVEVKKCLEGLDPIPASGDELRNQMTRSSGTRQQPNGTPKCYLQMKSKVRKVLDTARHDNVRFYPLHHQHPMTVLQNTANGFLDDCHVRRSKNLSVVSAREYRG